MVSAPACDGTGCEFDSWQCRIYILCSLSLRLLGSLRLGSWDLVLGTWDKRLGSLSGTSLGTWDKRLGSLSGYIWLDTKIVLKKSTIRYNCYQTLPSAIFMVPVFNISC